MRRVHRHHSIPARIMSTSGRDRSWECVAPSSPADGPASGSGSSRKEFGPDPSRFDTCTKADPPAIPCPLRSLSGRRNSVPSQVLTRVAVRGSIIRIRSASILRHVTARRKSERLAQNDLAHSCPTPRGTIVPGQFVPQLRADIEAFAVPRSMAPGPTFRHRPRIPMPYAMEAYRMEMGESHDRERRCPSPAVDRRREARLPELRQVN
jgi:hypothetical protein